MNLLAEPEHHKKARVRRARGFLLKAFSNATRHAFLRPQALIPAVASEKALASSGVPGATGIWPFVSADMPTYRCECISTTAVPGVCALQLPFQPGSRLMRRMGQARWYG